MGLSLETEDICSMRFFWCTGKKKKRNKKICLNCFFSLEMVDTCPRLKSTERTNMGNSEAAVDI